MSTGYRLAIALSLAMISSLAPAAQPAAHAETVGALLLRLQEQSAAPFVHYCGSKAPELQRPLETAYLQFKKRFRKATAPLRTQAATDSELSKAASSELIRQFEEMDAQSFAQTRDLEPRSFCAQLKNNLAGATAESIQTNMRSAFAQYKAAVRQGR
jgi:hypothetical protein